MSTLSARWVAYEARGARIGELPEPLGYEATVNRWDPGSFRLTYSTLAAAGDVLSRPLTQGLEVALEVSDGGAWVEPSSARFLVLDRDDDFLDDQAVKVLSGPSYDWQASKIKDLNASALEPEDAEHNAGMRVWAAATPGLIVKTLLDEASARGSAPFTFDFTATHDSAGQEWAQEVTWAEAHGQTLDVYLQKLTAQNRAEYDTVGRELRLFNVGGLTQDRTFTAIYDAETHVTAAPSSESISELAHRFTMTAGDGVNHEFLADSTPAPWGRWDWYDSDRDTTNAGTIQALLQAEAERSARVRGQYIRDLANPAEVTHWPLVHYGTGSWVTAPTHVRGEQTRVQQIILRDNGENPPTIALTLNDRWLDADERRRRRQAGIRGGGAAEGGGSEVTPPPPRPPDVDPRKPGKVVGVVSTSEAYLNPQGYARAQVSLSWAAVTTSDPPDGPFTPDRYEVDYKRSSEPVARWRRMPAVDGLSVDVSPLDAGTSYDFRVRARAAATTPPPGDWSDVHTMTTAEYLIPPPVPSTPILTVTLGVIKALWDGEDEDGRPMPLGFRRVEVAVSTSAFAQPGQADIIDTISAKGGAYIVTGSDTSTRYVWFRAVGAGGRSDWSARAQIDPRGDNVIDERVDHLIGNVIPELEGQITLAGGRFTGANRAPTASDGEGKPEGAIWNHYDGNRLVQSYIWEPNPLVIGTFRWSEREPSLVHIDGGTFGDLDGIRLRARTVLADRLAITPSNIFPDPYFVDADAWTGTGITTVDDEDMPGGRALQITSGTSLRTVYYHGLNHRALQLEPGATYRVRFTANLTGSAGSPTVAPRFRYTNASGGTSVVTGDAVSLVPARNTYTQLVTEITLPEAADAATLSGVGFTTQPPYGTGHTILIGSVDMTRKVGNILLEDGAVTADKINALEVWTNEIWAGHARAQVLTIGSINPKHLNFGTDELIPNPMWMDAEYRARYPMSTPGFSYSTNATYRIKGQSHTVMVNGAQVSNGSAAQVMDWLPCSPGDKFYLELTGRRGASTNFDVAIRLQYRHSDGSETTGHDSAVSLTAAMPASRHVTASGVATIPDGIEACRAFLVALGSPTTQSWYISEVSARRAMASIGDTGEGAEITPRGFRFWNEDGDPTIDAGNGTPNLFQGSFRTDVPNRGRPFVSISNAASDTGVPGINFSNDGGTGGPNAAIYLRETTATGSRGLLSLRSGQYGTLGERHRVRLDWGAEIWGDVWGGAGSQTNPTWTWEISSAGHADFSIGSTDQRYFDFPQNGFLMRSGGDNASGNNSTVGVQRVDGVPYFHSYPTYRRTVTSEPNVFVNQFGRHSRTTSLTAYKVDIADAGEHLAAVKQLRPVTYRDRGSVERGEHAPVLLGLLAEAVAATGVPGLTSDDLDGNLNGVQYGRVAVALIPWLHDLEARLLALEGNPA